MRFFLLFALLLLVVWMLLRRITPVPPAAAKPPLPPSIQEACSILDVAPDADEATIRAAHHRLMKQLHPDAGGNAYFASRLNEARDTLLARKPTP